MEITFKVNPIWLQDDELEETERTIIERVAQIVCFSPKVFSRDIGYGNYKWQLDDTNDWWIHREGDNFILSCRYNDKKFIDAVKVIVDKIFR